jgi:uncharacterized protein YegP (UPF0339 family)
MPNAQFEIFRDKADPSKFRWRFQATNSEIIAQSEAYNSKESAKNGIRVIKEQAAGAEELDKT